MLNQSHGSEKNKVESGVRSARSVCSVRCVCTVRSMRFVQHREGGGENSAGEGGPKGPKVTRSAPPASAQQGPGGGGDASGNGLLAEQDLSLVVNFTEGVLHRYSVIAEYYFAQLILYHPYSNLETKMK